MVKKLMFFLITIFLICSCKTSSNLIAPQDFTTQVKGLQLEFTLYDEKIKGEIIEVTPDAMMVMVEYKITRFIIVPVNAIQKAEIIVASTSDDPDKFRAMPFLLAASSLGHGFFGAFSLPINLICTIGVSLDASKGSYRMKYPDDVGWSKLHKFARFPQGLPPGFKFGSANSK